VYRDCPYICLVYPAGLIAYRTDSYENFPDMEVYSGITPSSFWYYFSIMPIDENQLPIFVTPPLTRYEAVVGEPITFTIGVSDPDGDPIGLNWSFGDGEVGGNYMDGDTTVERIISFTHVYTEAAADLTLTVALNDYPQHAGEVVATSTVDVVPVPDEPPVVLNISYDPMSAIVGQEVSWTVWAVDHEQGPDGFGLLFNWDWDDGTYDISFYENVTSDIPVADTQTHAWSEPGTYSVTVNVIDGPNNVSVSVPYTIGGINNPPNASFTVMPEEGPPGTIFTFDASSSYDLEDPVELLLVQWDWNGDGLWDTPLSTEKVAEHQYVSEGAYTVFLRVVDTDNLEGLDMRTVNVIQETGISVTDGTSVTIFEQTGDVIAYTFSVDDIADSGETFSTVAMLSEVYTVTLYGDWLSIECSRTPPYPTNGTGTGNNIVAVRLAGVPGYPEGLWASTILDYAVGDGGVAESRWNALGPADQIGPYGDSLCTYMGDGYSRIVLGWSTPAMAAVEATVDIDKDRINIASVGGWITAHIELPDGYDVLDIDLTTVCVDGVVLADGAEWSLGDYDKDGIVDLSVKFAKGDLASALEVGEEVEVTVSGALMNGTLFEGSDIVKVFSSKSETLAVVALGVLVSGASPEILTTIAMALAILAGFALLGVKGTRRLTVRR
ncbi:MAG: PKD domain-containing protein, partial [Thermoplasmata archaeon]